MPILWSTCSIGTESNRLHALHAPGLCGRMAQRTNRRQRLGACSYAETRSGMGDEEGREEEQQGVREVAATCCQCGDKPSWMVVLEDDTLVACPRHLSDVLSTVPRGKMFSINGIPSDD